jgi:hypothetical protein
MRNKIYSCLLLVFSVMAFAQQQPLHTSIDKTKNKIGAQFNLTLRASVDTTATVVFPKGKNFGAMEVIRNYVVDTIKKDNRWELVKKYGLAQFDSGKYTIPQLKVVINKKPFLTDSLRVEVDNVKVDTIKQKMYDIKPIMEGPQNHSWMWVFVVLAILAVGALGALVYFLVKRAQRKKTEEEIFKTPIEKATTLLSNLEKKELWQKGEIKHYYSELTDIARMYIEEVIHIPAMESTTTELISALRDAASKKRMSVTQETFENLERVLKHADLVKFAKSRPQDFEITEDRNKIERVIVTIDKSIPEETEETTDNDAAFQELQRQKILRKKRKTRILISVAVVIFVLFASIIYVIATKGLDYLKDNLIGNPTKELVEGEWVSSEYGNPAVTIETPKVLKRLDAEKVIPKNAMALMKEFQIFGYGSMMGNFYISVSTNTYKAETQIDLDKALQASVNLFEVQGAKNMLVKQEDFDTKEGITGRKAYGTFTRIDPIQKKSFKMYYEILLFGQNNGLQQITLQYEEGDKYAAQISERVLSSVELKKVGQ